MGQLFVIMVIHHYYSQVKGQDFIHPFDRFGLLSKEFNVLSLSTALNALAVPAQRSYSSVLDVAYTTHLPEAMQRRRLISINMDDIITFKINYAIYYTIIHPFFWEREERILNLIRPFLLPSKSNIVSHHFHFRSTTQRQCQSRRDSSQQGFFLSNYYYYCYYFLDCRRWCVWLASQRQLLPGYCLFFYFS